MAHTYMYTKIRATTEAPVPKNITQLRLFLGLVNYYGKFLPNTRLSSTMAPLSYGVSAILSHQMDECSERPVAYASFSPAPAERK